MSPKVRSLANYCFDLKFSKPSKIEVVARCKKILAAEKITNAPESLVEQIVDGSDCDIRQTINQLQADSFDWLSTVHAYDKKDKSTMLSPFDAAKNIFAPPAGATINDRLDMFFVDYDLIPLLVQQ